MHVLNDLIVPSVCISCKVLHDKEEVEQQTRYNWPKSQTRNPLLHQTDQAADSVQAHHDETEPVRALFGNVEHDLREMFEASRHIHKPHDPQVDKPIVVFRGCEHQ